MPHSDGRPGAPEAGLPLRKQIASFLPVLMEGILLTMAALAPWAYGAVHPGFEFLLYAGVSLLVMLWGLRMLLEGQVTWIQCSVTLCLALFFLIGTWQLMPLGPGILQRVSPGATQLYERLFPAQPEELPFGEVDHSPRSGRTLSLYPHATRLRLQRILAVFLVFAVVRNNLAGSRPLYRLGLLGLVNGALLSLFALAQFFSSPPGLLYWTYPSSGTVFGPFICRNHFPFYINMCMGLGLGLLWFRRFAEDKKDTEYPYADPSSWLDKLQSPLRLLNDPASLAICLALALMFSAVAFSLSRGGLMALVGGFGVCALVKIRRSAGWLRPGSALVILVLAIGLLGWFGLGEIQERWSTIWERTAWEESRLPLWEQALAIAKDFPVAGTGYGTYEYVNPLYPSDAIFYDYVVDHVHNDYLEILVESGVAGLLLSLVTIGLVFRCGYRAANNGRASGGLALGALFAFTTLVLHSGADFGIHLPAITLLATVVCAQLCGLGGPAHQGELDNSRQYTLRLGGLAPILGAAVCVALGLVLFDAGWKLHSADSLSVSALRMRQKSDADSLPRQRAYLEAAIRIAPTDSGLRTELGEVFADLYRLHHERNKGSEAAATMLVMLASSPAPVLTALPSAALVAAGPRRSAGVQEPLLRRTFLVPALRSFLEARARGPLLPGPHLGLAVHADKFARADSARNYRQRVQALASFDAALWFYFGDQELRNGQKEEAWRSWRRCLELSERHLRVILERGVKILGPEALVREVLPDRPEQLLASAWGLYPDARSMAEREPFLRKALLLLSKEPATPQNMHTRARVHKALKETDAALTQYQALLDREPVQVAWRFEYAQILHEAARLEEAQEELRKVLAYAPGHVQARALLKQLSDRKRR